MAVCVKKNAREANDVMLQLLMMSTGSYCLVVFDGCVYKCCSLVVSMFHCIIIDRPEGTKEIFNYRHSFLRNVIERCFGILKARFPVLKMMPRYKPCRQGNVMRVYCTIHNFIRMATRNDHLFTQFNIDNLTVEGESRDNSGELSHTVELTDQAAKAMIAYKDHIAGLMLANNRHH